MCTQYITTKSVTEIARLFTARERGPFPRVSSELFPGRVGAVVGRSADGERGVAAMRWGWPPPAGVRAPVVNVRNSIYGVYKPNVTKACIGAHSTIRR